MLNTLTLDGLHPVLTRIGLQHPVLTFPILLAMTVLVASVSYRYFESPFLTLKSRFEELRTEPRVTAGKARAA
jgi:peptidoglycan/LPS O-acetylase OafA/YrhL